MKTICGVLLGGGGGGGGGAVVGSYDKGRDGPRAVCSDVRTKLKTENSLFSGEC